MNGSEVRGLPLSGVRVLDLSRALAGPYCAMILGDLGADVIKVEPTPSGEMIRSWGPFDRGISVYYLSVNRNKRSLAINFRAPEALELLRSKGSPPTPLHLFLDLAFLLLFRLFSCFTSYTKSPV